MQTIGVVAGSFDPITHGHAWLIQQAARLVGKLHVVVGVNPAKKYMFSEAERYDLVEEVLKDLTLSGTPTELHFLRNDLLIRFAESVSATHLIRGIRNAEDFNYETQMALVNRRIAPTVETTYLCPPPELSMVSSSTVKGLVGFGHWEDLVADYVPPCVLGAIKSKIGSN